jgi:hypothetical protein
VAIEGSAGIAGGTGIDGMKNKETSKIEHSTPNSQGAWSPPDWKLNVECWALNVSPQ